MPLSQADRAEIGRIIKKQAGWGGDVQSRRTLVRRWLSDYPLRDTEVIVDNLRLTEPNSAAWEVVNETIDAFAAADVNALSYLLAGLPYQSDYRDREALERLLAALPGMPTTPVPPPNVSPSYGSGSAAAVSNGPSAERSAKDQAASPIPPTIDRSSPLPGPGTPWVRPGVGPSRVNWLHISDIHLKDGDPYDSDVVLKALVKNVAETARTEWAPDLILITGDIAQSGKPDEYTRAEHLCDDLLSAANLDRSRLFVIPGNHDVDRSAGRFLLRTLSTEDDSVEYFKPSSPQPHRAKLNAFVTWHDAYFKGIRTLETSTTCQLQAPVEIHGLPIHILTIDSALFCQGDDDHGKLWVGRRCLDAALESVDKAGPGLRIALIHHPFEWLHPDESVIIETALQDNVDIILRGHLHEPRSLAVADSRSGILSLASGAAYQTRQYPNQLAYATFDAVDSVVRIYPIRYEDRPRSQWTLDPSLYWREDQYVGRFAVGLKKGPKVNGANRAPSGTAKPQGTAAGGSTAPKKASSTDDVVRQSLERRLKDTLAEYEVAMRQASYALDDVTRMRLEKSAEARLADAKRIEREIDEIGE